MNPCGTGQDLHGVKFALSPTGHPINPVAIIGVGNMGGAMVRRLLGLGWTVRVCDIEPAKTQCLEPFGALVLDTPAQAAINFVVFMVVVVDAQQTEDVLFGANGLADTLQPGQTVMLCPTLAPNDVVRFAQRLDSLGVQVLDAPMSGGPSAWLCRAIGRSGPRCVRCSQCQGSGGRGRCRVVQVVERRPKQPKLTPSPRIA